MVCEWEGVKRATNSPQCGRTQQDSILTNTHRQHTHTYKRQTLVRCEQEGVYRRVCMGGCEWEGVNGMVCIGRGGEEGLKRRVWIRRVYKSRP